MSNKKQNTHLKVAMSSLFKMAISINIPRFVQFLWERGQGYNKSTYKKIQADEGRMLPAVLAQVWRLKLENLLLLSLATDASMVRERCWLLEGTGTQQIEQQIENRPDNCLAQ